MVKTVYFRAFEEEDAELIYQWMNDDELKKMSVGLNRRMCKNEALEWVKARMHHNNYQVFWAICARDSNKMIGYACLTDIHYINSSANFSGIVIGDRDYQDGLAWIETYLFIYEYVFERFDAAFKNGRYYDVSISSVLSNEYFHHKNAGEYEMSAILKRMRKAIKDNKDQ